MKQFQAAAPLLFVAIGGMIGPEDLVVDRSQGAARLLVSSVDRIDETAEGTIFSVDPGAPEPRPMTIVWRQPQPRFRPHGIALVDGRLFVINHGKPEAIEVFRVDGMTLHHEERIVHPDLVQPNDLDARALPGGGYELFVSNPARGTLKMLWELLGGSRFSFVARLRRNGATWESRRIRGFRYPNGVAVGSGGRLHVSASFDGALVTLPIDDDGNAAARERLDLGGLADNIGVAPDGALLVTASKSAWSFAKHARAAKKHEKTLLPAKVWRIEPAAPQKATLLFEDDGRRISGASSAVCIGDDLYVGQVFGDFVLKVAGACRK